MNISLLKVIEPSLIQLKPSTLVALLKPPKSTLFSLMRPSEWALCTTFGIIFLIGVVGNASVIYEFGFKKKSKQRLTADCLILYLGIADFLSLLFNPLLYIYFTVTRYQQWHFGSYGCKIIPAIGQIMSSISIGVLLIFAVDRYLAITSPIKGSALSKRTVTLACIIDVILTICLYLHYMLALKLHSNHNGGLYCSVPSVKSLYYSISKCLLVFFRFLMCVLVYIFTTVQILLTVKKSRKILVFSKQRKKLQEDYKKTAYMLFMMCLVFFFLVFPREIFHLTYVLSWMVKEKGILYTPILVELNAWLKVLTIANSCANVLIYSRVQKIYFKEFFKYFGKFWRKKVVLNAQDIKALR
ncbi:somatostatin receptor type 2 isoform X2 [Hydra vulgaris]|nr:somatostatin receptor type 2 isoform X2 [Hydra vulgaris]XP_047144064.1 somatostatin receptor type 2 isoform X2 [Hydra vulgaris]